MDSTTGISRKMLICQLVSAFISDLPLLLCGLGNSEEFNRESNLTEIFRAIPLPTRCFYKDILDFYIEIYALQVLQIIALVMANLGCDCYFFGIGMNLVSQIRRFANDLERFEPQSDELKNQQTLRVMIRQHTHLIQMAAHLEEIFSFVIALQVLASVYQISSAGVQVLLSIRWSDPATAMSYSIYVCIFLMQLAIYNYAGECLSSSISSLQRSLYQCSWYHLSPKASRDFLFIMTRCGKRFHLTAGRIIPMNLESYKSIIKTLGSYFSVMQAILHPSGNDYESLICHSDVLTGEIFQLTMMISIAGEMHLDCAAVSDRIQNISLFSCALMTIVKVIIIRTNNSKMLDVILSAMDDWSNTQTASEENEMLSCAKLGRTICLFQMIASYITTVPIILGGFAVSAAVNTSNSTDPVINYLPLGTVCLFGEMSSGFYTVLYITQSIQLLTTCTGNIGCNCFFFGLTMHLSGQVQKLTDDMEVFGKNGEDTDRHGQFVSLVKRQNHLLELAQNLEATFNVIILVELSALTYEICLIDCLLNICISDNDSVVIKQLIVILALQMVVNLRMGNTVVIINSIIMLQILHLQLFLYSYAGERLSSGFENLGSAIYNCQWCDLPCKITKEFVLVMMRSYKTFTLTAGKICVMNLESFKNIVKAVGSYFSVLLAMFD
ncbi:uncharacterized protein [Fopius arisanus]|uniref:Odorant receptor n=1 Tax=Fopius arisanus TaxID=64838 RepID=A0A9R1TWV5_9HYME|nr:PREDICTED: uncharacterized protein LOC105264040 [Fopius arisanus]